MQNNKIKNRKTEKIIKAKICFFLEKINKIDKALAGLIKRVMGEKMIY